jgi:SAM-dependent methyltransferase
MPRIGSTLPAISALEIAPGFGRWTEFLLRYCNSYSGVDLSDRCVNNCRQRFAGRPNTEFFLNDGKSLAAVAARRFDLVFSFDSLVHADLDAMAQYVPQIIELLTPGGVAFLHHSNMAALPGESVHHRSKDVSADIVRALILKNSGRVLVQERFSWAENVMSDCFSMFCRASDHLGFEAQDITDNGFMIKWECRLATERFQRYLKLKS